ncbi:MAG: carboxypeptidase regulatory-like domain-containing protein [Desulfurococcaceae archaeon]
MDNKLSILILLLIIVSHIPIIPVVHAATRTVDGDPSDWTGTPPVDDNTYSYSEGEWIWRDAAGDERTDFASPDPGVDLVEFRVTGDIDYIYLLFKFNSMAGFNIGDNGATFIALAIDRDRIPGSGVEWFAGESDTKTSDLARWEYQLVINLADSRYSGQGLRSIIHYLNESTNNWGAIFQLLDTNWNHIYVAGDDGTYGILAVNLDLNTIEVRLKWDLIGGRPLDGEYIRLTLITARGWSNYGGNGGGAWDIGGVSVSDALDAVTTTLNTWDEVQDQVVDYYVDIRFVNGEPTPPPPPVYKVYGYVIDQYNNPVVNAHVVLDSLTNYTDVNGYFEFTVGSGSYFLRISKGGYETITQTVVVSDTDVNLGTIVLWKFMVDTTSNVNDFPDGSLVYQAPRLITATGNSENALTIKYIAWDEKYLYIGIDFAPGTWGLALGIGIDANPGMNIGYSTGTDSWGRKISFSNAYIDYQIYFWVDGGNVIACNYNKYNPDGTWSYNFAPVYYSPLAVSHDGQTLFKIAVPWNSINTTSGYNGTIVIVTWIAGGGDSSAVSSLPLNPDVLTNGGGEWTDSDTIYMYISITIDQDSNGIPDTGVTPIARTRFHPVLTTSITTDKDVYSVYPGYKVSVEITLSDELNYNLPLLDVAIYDSANNMVATGYTGLNGKVTLEFTAPSTPGDYIYTVKFNGHAGWLSSEKTITVSVITPVAEYKVYGYVLDRDTRYGVENALVEILDFNTWSVIASNYTNFYGYYEFKVYPGVYIIRVNKTIDRYAIYTVKVIVTGDTRVDVELMRYLIDIRRNINDFPADSIVYIAKDFLTTVIGAKHNLSRVYIAWDTEYLYIGSDLAPEGWWIAYGIGIDVNPGNSTTGYGAVWCTSHGNWEDGWSRRINFTTPYSIGPIYPELEVYFWIQGWDGVTSSQINRYLYETYPPIVGPDAKVNHWSTWYYGYSSPLYSPVATTKDGSTLFKVAIPWSAIMRLPGIEYTGELALVIWVAHGDFTSAVTALPLNPLSLDKTSWDELGDVDVMYMTIRIVYDVDKNYAPDIVPYNTRFTFYPELDTVIETDSDVYETGTGMTVEINARVRDILGNYLPFVKVELYDYNNVKIGEGLTKFNTGGLDAFTVKFQLTAPNALGEYRYKLRFIGEAGFKPVEKTIIVNVTRTGTRIVDLTYRLYIDADRNGRISSGDTIEILFKLEAFNKTWIPLEGKDVKLRFNYTLNKIVDEVVVKTGSGGLAIYRYVVKTVPTADIIELTAIFEGDETYMASSASVLIEINLARAIDGKAIDWGTGIPRSVPGIAPRGDEIVILDPVKDINIKATGVYSELDVVETRITYDGVNIYFFVKFAGKLSKPDHFTVNIAIDATPNDIYDGVDYWLYGYWFTDTRLGGFDPLTKTLVNVKWTHIIEAIPIENKVNLYVYSGSPKSAGRLAVNTAEGFIEFAVPVRELAPIDLSQGIRVWITVFGVSEKGKYFNPPGSNVIDIVGVDDTNRILLTTRDPRWDAISWPSEDVWVETSFLVKFSTPLKPDIPDPSPDIPPKSVEIVYIVWNGTAYSITGFQNQYPATTWSDVLIVARVTGTQGRPVIVLINGKEYRGVADIYGFAQIPATLPGLVYDINITVVSDGLVEEYIVETGFKTPPIPEPVILPLLLIIVLITILVFKKKNN